jgi:hypothetical protein
MRNATIAILGCWLAVATCTHAKVNYSEKVAALEKSFMEKAKAIVSAADAIDVALQKFDWKSKATDQARMGVTNMLKASAWRDLPSRDTRRHSEAVAVLQRYIQEGNGHIERGRKELNGFKEAEFLAWAAAHPEEARALEINRRLEAAENAARNASYAAQQARQESEQASQKAQRASQDAQRASQDAQDAQQRAVRAQRQAQESDQKAGRAEDALQQHGIHSW